MNGRDKISASDKEASRDFFSEMELQLDTDLGNFDGPFRVNCFNEGNLILRVMNFHREGTTSSMAAQYPPEKW